eukprot:2793809-Pyramimonas_sp.AAC.1
MSFSSRLGSSCVVCFAGGFPRARTLPCGIGAPPPPYSKRALSHIHRFSTRRHPADQHRHEDLEIQRRLQFPDPELHWLQL